MSEQVVSPGEIIGRCLEGSCPDCGELLPPGAPWNFPKQCPHCSMMLRRHDGFFLGALCLNYGMVTFFALPIPALLWNAGVITGSTALGIIIGATAILPPLLYRLSWKFWLAGYYGILPEQLPANASDHPESIDD